MVIDENQQIVQLADTQPAMVYGQAQKEPLQTTLEQVQNLVQM